MMNTNNKKISNGLKKISIIFLSLLMMIVLSACTKQSTNNTSQNTTDTTSVVSPANNAIDISSHNKAEDCWTIINGVTYNITDYVVSNQHPGGSNIKDICGKDGSNAFNAIQKHSKIGNLLEKYKVQ